MAGNNLAAFVKSCQAVKGVKVMGGKRIDSQEVEPVPVAGGERQLRILLDGCDKPGMPLALARYSYRPEVTGPRHSHASETEVYYCLAGSGRVEVGESTFTLNPGVVIYIPPGLEHQTTSGSEGLEFLAFFTPPVKF